MNLGIYIIFNYIQTIVAIKAKVSCGYICSEVIRKPFQTFNCHPSEMKLKNVTTKNFFPFTSVPFKCVSSAELLLSSNSELNDIEIEIQYVLIPKPLYFNPTSTISYICYEYQFRGSSFWLYRPMTFLLYEERYVEGTTVMYSSYLTEKKAEDILKRIKNMKLDDRTNFLKALADSGLLDELNLFYIKDIKRVKEIIIFCFDNIESMEIKSLTTKLLQDLGELYLIPLTKMESSEREDKNRCFYNLMVEFDVILIYLASNSFLELEENIYDYTKIIQNNPITCEECLLFEIIEKEVETISINVYDKDLIPISSISGIKALTYISIKTNRIPVKGKYLILTNEGSEENGCVFNLEKDINFKQYNLLPRKVSQ